MKLHFVLTAALLAASPAAAAPAGAAVPAAVQSAPAALKALCDKLAALVTPSTIVPQQADRIIEVMLQTMLEKDEGFRSLNAKYPGLAAAIGQRVRPRMIESSNLTMPLYRAELSELYAANFTLAEATAAVAFFSSEDGRALISSANANLNYAASVKALATGGEAQTSDLRQDTRAAAQQTVSAMSPARKARVAAFFASPAGQKIIAMGPRKGELDQKWFNYSPPGLEEKVARATIEAMVDHIGKTDPETARRMREALVAKGLLPKG